MKAIDELRSMRGNCAMYEDLVTRCCEIADEIERELEERYIEGPTDKNGDPITYRSKIYQWGALEYIACKMHPDGTYEWFVRGHDTSAPLLKASEVEAFNPPTVEDVLWELLSSIRPEMEDDEAVPIVRGFAERLQLKERDDG